eukprot:scaffold2340_cov185-Ochromonas_danica.AAC.2
MHEICSTVTPYRSFTLTLILSNKRVHISHRALQAELENDDFPLSLRAFQNHLRLLKPEKTNLAIKPYLTYCRFKRLQVARKDYEHVNQTSTSAE